MAQVTALADAKAQDDTGFTEEFWKPVRAYWRDQNPQTEAGVRQALTLEAIRWQYLHGVPDESLVPVTVRNKDPQRRRPAVPHAAVRTADGIRISDRPDAVTIAALRGADAQTCRCE